MFEIGEKVECVDVSIKPEMLEWIKANMPNWVEVKTYTVRGVNVHADFVVGVLLEEIHNPECFVAIEGKILEPHFASWRFRKLVGNVVTVEEVNEELIDI